MYPNPKFIQNNTEGINSVIRKKHACVIVLVMFYVNKTTHPIRVYRVLRCVLYSVIENHVCIYYLCFHFKILSVISSDKIFEQASYNG